MRGRWREATRWRRPTSAAGPPDVPAQEDSEYVRHGVADLFLAFEPLAGWRHVAVTERWAIPDLAAPMRHQCDVWYPDAAVRLVRRGVMLSVGAVLVEARAVGVPDSLLTKTCEVVAVWSAGGTLPQPLVNLVQGGLPVRRTMFLGLVAAVVTTVVGVGLTAQTPQAPPPPAPPAVPAPPVVAPANPKPVELATPRIRQAMDLELSTADRVALHPNGKTVAVHGRGDSSRAGGPKSVPHVLLVRDVFDRGAEVDYLERAEKIVGFTPDGSRLITDLREYALASGFHRLSFWNVEPGKADSLSGGGGEPRRVDLDADQTSEYAFAPDAKSFRTVFYGVRKTNGYAKLEVHEVDAATGRTVKSVFKAGDGECARFALSADGKVLVTAWAGPEVGVSAYDVDKSEHLWTRVTAVDGDPVSRDGLTPEVGVSPRGDRVVVGFGTSRLLVLNGKTGEPLPALQGDRPFVQARGQLNAAFSADGRLLAASGLAYPTAEAFRGPTHKSMFCVWETVTGRVVRFSDGVTAVMGFHPSRPLLALVEKNGGKTRLGLWDFAAHP